MKIARSRDLLTPKQRQALMQIPEEEWVLGTYYTFSKRDLEIINKRSREEKTFRVRRSISRSSVSRFQKPTGSFNEDLLHHMSPLGWEHINLLGAYHFNSEKVISLDSLRPLKLS